MPGPLAIIAAEIAVGAAAAASTIGGALGALTLAEGVLLAGTALQTVGTLTGNSTLAKVGAGLTLAGGVGAVASSVSARSAAGVTGNNSAKSTNLLEVDNIDDILATSTKGSTSAADLAAVKAPTDDLGTLGRINNDVGDISGYSGGTGIEGGANQDGILKGMNETLKEYDGLMGVVGGVGDAYMANRKYESAEDVNQAQIDYREREINRRSNNINGGTGASIPTPQFTQNQNAYRGVLGR